MDHLPPREDQSSSTSSSLLNRARARDAAAWERLIRLYSPLVHHWARRAGLQASDVSDVTQETFRAVAQSLAKFQHQQGSGSFRGWLWTITKHKILDLQRRHDPQPRGGSHGQQELARIPAPDAARQDELPDSPPEDSPGTTAAALARQALAMLEHEFEPRTWQAFWGMVVLDRSAADLAADLGLSKGAVRQAKHRVLKRFREEFAELLE